MSIPLIQKPEKDDINTSIIAIKRNIERINMLLGLSNSEEIDTSEFVKKSDIVDVVEAGNMNPVTSNAVVPVDEVTVGNMQSVTSNAVAKAIGSWTKVKSNAYTNETVDISGAKSLYLEWTNGSSTAIGYYYLPIIESGRLKYTVVGNTSEAIGIGYISISSDYILTVSNGSWTNRYSLWLKY